MSFCDTAHAQKKTENEKGNLDMGSTGSCGKAFTKYNRPIFVDKGKQQQVGIYDFSTVAGHPGAGQLSQVA